MVSEAVSVFSEQAEQVAERIGRAQDTYAGVSRALSDYVSPLATAQSWSADVLADASGAHSVAMSAEDDMARFRYQLGDVSLDEAERARSEPARTASWTEAIVEIALALVPLGAGRLIGAGMKTVHAATRTAAATSVMRSAAGQGISRVTRTVALRQVDDVAATVTSRILSGTDLRVVAETAAMANMRLTGGGMSRHVLNVALPMAAFGGAWILNGPAVPFIEAGLKQGTKGWRDATTGTIRNEDW